MKAIAELLFESSSLKYLPRSGYRFLGVGQESVAEHTYTATFIAFVMSRLRPDVDAQRLVFMCLVHDLAETRTGDLNYLQKQYVAADQPLALDDALGHLPFGSEIKALVTEFEAGDTREARLARDADQLAFIIDLKALADMGHTPPKNWLPAVIRRLKTETGRALCKDILATEWDDWWLKNYIDTPKRKE